MTRAFNPIQSSVDDPTGNRPLGIVIHGLHKSATMFLYQLAFRLCRDRRIRMFSANHKQPDDDQLTIQWQNDFCLAPVRTFKRDRPLPGRANIRRIFQLRDPRDILVSEYYSFGWSHSDQRFDQRESKTREQIRDMSVDQYVLDGTGAVRRLENHLKPLLRKPPREQDVVVRYEQMVTGFRDWLSLFIEAFEFPTFGIRSRRLIHSAYSLKYRNEFKPDNRPTSHKRSVRPGDYLRRLRPDTIEQLNERLQPILQSLGYPVGDQSGQVGICRAAVQSSPGQPDRSSTDDARESA